MLICITNKHNLLLETIKDKGRIVSINNYEQDISEYVIESELIDYDVLSDLQFVPLTLSIYSFHMIEYIMAMIQRVLCVVATSYTIYNHNRYTIFVPYVDNHMIYRDKDVILNFKVLLDYPLMREYKVLSTNPLSGMYTDNIEHVKYTNGMTLIPINTEVNEPIELMIDDSYRYLESFINTDKKVEALENVAKVKVKARTNYYSVYYKPYKNVLVDKDFIYHPDKLILVGEWMIKPNNISDRDYRIKLFWNALDIDGYVTPTFSVVVKKTSKWRDYVKIMNRKVDDVNVEIYTNQEVKNSKFLPVNLDLINPSKEKYILYK